MPLGVLADRAAAALILLAAGGLLAWRLPIRRARVAWGALILLTLGYDLALNLQPRNFPGGNFTHYYLGAKYPAPYGETYRLFKAGLGQAPLSIRDLERPARVAGATLAEQRAYHLDLLRAAGVEFSPLASLDSLAALARDSGLVEAQSQSVLARHLPASRRADFRRDVRAFAAGGRGNSFVLDYGYNGSPFYGLLRRLDPTLLLPFGWLPALAGFAWQLLGVALLAWLSGPVLGYSLVERLAVAGLVLACQDFANFAMTGLQFTELWVVVMLAALALRRGQPVLAGAAIAVAGLLKLFPFLLLLAAVVPLAQSFRPGRSPAAAAGVRQRMLLLLASCLAVTLTLGLLSQASGRTWAGFLHKISVEFTSGINLINSVSVAAGLTALGVPDGSPLYPLATLAALAALLALFWRGASPRGDDLPARRALILMAATGLLVKSWLNYYGLLVFILLPLVARRRPGLAAAMVAGMAGVYLLPGFDDLTGGRDPWLHLLKIVPYVAVPAGLVWLELREDRWSRRAVRVALVAGLVLALATAWEAWRGGEVRRLGADAEAQLANGYPAGAAADFEKLMRLRPADARAQRKYAVAQAMMGRLEQALPAFARAVALSPDDVAARDDYGRALAMGGRIEEAVVQLEAARALDPTEVQVLFQLARLYSLQGRKSEAIALMSRARELAPQEPAIQDALRELGGAKAS